MKPFRLATFNCENLFARHTFKGDPAPFRVNGFKSCDLAMELFGEEEKRITADAIRALDADILCLQEVESLPVLDEFAARLLPGAGYKHRILVDSYDPRQIDVAVLSRFPIVHVRTFREEPTQDGLGKVFSRDCLEVDLSIDGAPFTVYANHFKSMMQGREATGARRAAQAGKVVEILHQRWGQTLDGPFAVLGDLNDFLEPGLPSAIDALARHRDLVNVVELLPAEEQWTHFYAKGRDYRQLDYLLLPRGLHEASGRPKPSLYRCGQPLRAQRYQGPRLEGVGQDRPKASDHCPVFIDLWR